MNSKYDVIVVGAGNGGLVSALTLLEKGYNVLLLDEHNDVGGLSKSIVRGRFEFEPSFHTLFLANPQDSFNINGLFQELKIDNKIKFSRLPNFFKLLTLDENSNGEKVNYDLPFGIDNFINKIEEYCPGSSDRVRDFFDLALECKEAMKYIKKQNGNVDYDFMKDEYSTFVKIATYSISKVMDILDVPLEAQEIINAYWLYFGSPETELSFVQYAIFIYDAVNSGLCIPNNRSYEISYSLFDKYLELGGKVQFNSKVIKLLLDDDQVTGVRLYDGSLYYADNVIVNSTMSNVYGKLINRDEIPKKAIKRMNAAKLGGRLFTVYLGLNMSYQELGFDSYNYFIYHSLDSDMEYNRMKDINSGNLVATVLNAANKDCCSEGTCILELSTLFFDDCFNSLNNSNYDDINQNIVNKLIDSFEDATKIKIRDYIEEIEYRTPVSVASINGNLEGSIFGYQFSGEDNLLDRIMNKKNEEFIKGLKLCGGLDGDIYNQCSSYVTGLEAALEVHAHLGGDK